MIRASRLGAAICALAVYVLAMPYTASAKKSIVTNIASNEVVVLQPSDPIPYNAQELNTIEINGNNPSGDCSYFEILASAKAEARRINANIIKIDQHTERNNANNCDIVKATFYRASNAHTYEHEFSWNKNRKLSWEDFKGDIPGNAGDNTAAATYCGIGFETNTVTENNLPRIFIYNTFYVNQSWVRGEVKTPAILAHEQGHFDICELYTRILRERMDEANVTVYNLRNVLQRIYNEVNNEYQACQQQYEDETEHGIIDAQQQRWLAKIDRELKNSEMWASDRNINTKTVAFVESKIPIVH